MNAYAIAASRPAGYGALASGLLLAAYFGVLTAISGWQFTVAQFSDFWLYIVPLAAGFGLQVTLYTRLRQLLHQSKDVARRDGDNRRHLDYGESLFLLQPNVKEGAGTLRDYHTAYWVARGAQPSLRNLDDFLQFGLLTERDRDVLLQLEAHLILPPLRDEVEFVAYPPQEIERTAEIFHLNFPLA